MYGLSVYPYKENLEETFAYIDKAAYYGFGRVFTNLLALPVGKKEQILTGLRQTIVQCRLHDMEVVLDVSPTVFTELGIDYRNLEFFSAMGATAIRLDQNFDGMPEAMMSYNPEGLDIELNISSNTDYVENILAYRPLRQKLIGCHNFYPQRYTALDYDYFRACNAHFKGLGLRTAAFVNSPNATHGPHPFTDGLCTLEMHRDMSLELQVKHYIALNDEIDDVIIANAYASEEELRLLSGLSQSLLYFKVEFSAQATALEREIVLNYLHYNRGDINSYSFRSTAVRLRYREAVIKPYHNVSPMLEVGDITIGNDNFGQYKGELALVKQAMPNLNNTKNVVAKVVPEELFLLKYIEPWGKFKFCQ